MIAFAFVVLLLGLLALLAHMVASAPLLRTIGLVMDSNADQWRDDRSEGAAA